MYSIVLVMPERKVFLAFGFGMGRGAWESRRSVVLCCVVSEIVHLRFSSSDLGIRFIKTILYIRLVVRAKLVAGRARRCGLLLRRGLFGGCGGCGVGGVVWFEISREIQNNV